MLYFKLLNNFVFLLTSSVLCFIARMCDYIDTGIMEGVQHSLLEVSKRESLLQPDCTTSKTITLHSKVCFIQNTFNSSFIIKEANKECL